MSASDGESGISLVLLDLDGTLADTAPDMIGALQSLAAEKGFSLPTPAELRPLVSEGSVRLLQTLFDLDDMPESDRLQLREEFLRHYAARRHSGSQLFDGMAQLLRQLQHDRMRWGIVTSKPVAFCETLLQRLELSPACLLCPEHTQHTKPHPEPVLAALKALDCPPQQAIFAGDHRRDLLSGRKAGVATVGCFWGYSLTAADRELCDFCADTPEELGDWLRDPGPLSGQL